METYSFILHAFLWFVMNGFTLKCCISVITLQRDFEVAFVLFLTQVGDKACNLHYFYNKTTKSPTPYYLDDSFERTIPATQFADVHELIPYEL